MTETFTYRAEILEDLARHGLRPVASSSPQRLRDAVRDLYKFEIKKLRRAYLDGTFPKREFAGRVVELRKRYWLLSIPTPLWVISSQPGNDGSTQ